MSHPPTPIDRHTDCLNYTASNYDGLSYVIRGRYSILQIPNSKWFGFVWWPLNGAFKSALRGKIRIQTSGEIVTLFAYAILSLAS